MMNICDRTCSICSRRRAWLGPGTGWDWATRCCSPASLGGDDPEGNAGTREHHVAGNPCKIHQTLKMHFLKRLLGLF